MPSRLALLSFSLLSVVLPACSHQPAPPRNGQTGGTQTGAGESFVGPFTVEHPYRGPGLVLPGVLLVGERGSVLLSIDAFDSGRDVVFEVSRGRGTPADWLDACPMSAKEPKERAFQVTLQGVGDVSANAMTVGPNDEWSTSIHGTSYVKLRTIRLEVCGRVYNLGKAHAERVALHQRMVGEVASR
jgi:hypothetical protein